MNYVKIVSLAVAVSAGALLAMPALADSVSPTTVVEGAATTYILVSCPTAPGGNVIANVFSSSSTSTPIDRAENGGGIHCQQISHFLSVPANLPSGTYYVDVYSTNFLIADGTETRSAVEASAGFVESLPFTVVGTSNTVSAPTIASITPNAGTVAGGTSVTVTGTGFANGAVLTIGGVPATSVSVSADGTSIVAGTPVGFAGAVNVAVTNLDTGTASLSGAFTYTVPAVVPTPTPIPTPTSAPVPTPSPTPVPVATPVPVIGSAGSTGFNVGLLSGGGGLDVDPAFPSSRGQVLGASTVAAHPDGTLVLDGTTVYLIRSGQRYAFRNGAEFKTYGYSFGQVVLANSADTALLFSSANILKAKAGSVILDAADNRTVYVIGDGGTKQGFASAAVFRQHGYSFAGLPVIDLSDYPSAGVIAT